MISGFPNSVHDKRDDWSQAANQRASQGKHVALLAKSTSTNFKGLVFIPKTEK